MTLEEFRKKTDGWGGGTEIILSINGGEYETVPPITDFDIFLEPGDNPQRLFLIF